LLKSPLKITQLIRLIAATLAAAVLLSGCSLVGLEKESKHKVLKVGVLIGAGGLGDRSFNDSAYSGLLEAQKQYNIRFETVTPVTEESRLDSLRLFAGNSYDLIIGVAFENQNALEKVAREYPKLKFGGIDFESTEPNIASIVYREQEGDFLMGVLAARLSQSKYVGVIGGADIPSIRRIMAGFKQGVVYQDPAVGCFTDFAGTFSDPELGLKIALARYKEGADIIHNAASKTGLGIIEAAKQSGKFTTGTSGDQRYLAPGNIIGNRPKKVDTAVLMLIDDINKGRFKGGVRSLGLKENGLMLGPFDPGLVDQDTLGRLENLKRDIINGKIKVEAQ
jgi:basic membrane protein A and related proteins